MIIELPTKFFYQSQGNNTAYVKNGILYVEGNIKLEDLMYALTYTMKGYDRCFYCGRELEPRQRTIDHMFPRVYGGPSITNNLVPSCKNCNSTKSCLTTRQFYYYRSRKTAKEKEIAFRQMIASNDRKSKKKILIPASWITQYPIEKIVDYLNFSAISESGDKRMERYYKRYGHYPKPAVISSNDWLFEGLGVFYHAKENHIEKVPAIIMENVVHLSRSKM